MPLSQNGFRANRVSDTAVFTVPGTTVKLRVRKGEPGTVLLYVAKRFNAEVEQIDTRKGVKGFAVPDDWGYASRPIRGSKTVLSNHASGTAIDLNATRHPRGVASEQTFSPEQLAAIRKILHTCNGVIRWGGDYINAPDDGMHFEIVGTPGEVALLATKIRTHFQVAIRRVLKKGSKGSDVKAVQKRLITLGFLPAGSADGGFGPKTYAAVKAFKKTRKWLRVLHNGEVGKGTVKLLGGSLQWKD